MRALVSLWCRVFGHRWATVPRGLVVLTGGGSSFYSHAVCSRCGEPRP